MPKYPNIKVKLVGEDGNAFFILGRVNAALRKGGVSEAERKEFQRQATSGDYSNLLCVCMAWVDCD